MLSKAKIKFVQSLKDKKFRQEHGLFVVEGNKGVAELLSSKIQVKTLFATGDWLHSQHQHIKSGTELIETTADDLKKVSFTQSPQDVVALALLPAQQDPAHALSQKFTLVLDTIQDPGNMGTIIRIADWYGLDTIICSQGCADVYSPKVIQATVGSFARVQVVETDLHLLFASNPDLPVYGAVMNGKSLYGEKMNKYGILLIGNEGKGIDPALLKYITHPITIPKRGHAESLNAAVAMAVICDAWAREVMGYEL